MLEVITMRELKRGLTANRLSDKLPCKLVSDSQTICVLLPIATYNQLVRQFKLPFYNPAIHKAGDKVLVKKGKRLVETIVPELDAGGNLMPDY